MVFFTYRPSFYNIFRLFALFILQTITFSRSKRVIFLSTWSRHVVYNYLMLKKPSVIIPNGVSQDFFDASQARIYRPKFNKTNPLRLVYTSTLDFYKNHHLLIEAVQLCLDSQIYIELKLLGPSNLPIQQHQHLMESINNLCTKNSGNFVEYVGPVPNHQLPSYYLKSDIGLFASSFENMPIIPLEYMATGLPCVVYSAEPMKTQLLSSALFFTTSYELFVILKSLYNFPERLYNLSIKSKKFSSELYLVKFITHFCQPL